MDTDILHEPNDQKEWNESFYFNLYDKGNDIYAFMRIGLKPNKKEISMFCFISAPDVVAGKRGQGRIYHKDLEIQGLKYEKIEPEKKWRLMFDGDMKVVVCNAPEYIEVKFDLEFNALEKVFNYRECVSGFEEEISQSVASEHLEQFGRITGTLEVLGRVYQIDALGERDHSWGVRDWNAPKNWIWLTGQFSEDMTFNLTKLTVEQGEVDAGFFYQDGRYDPLVKSKVDTVFGSDGVPTSFELELIDKEGVKRAISAKVLKNITLHFLSDDKRSLSIMYETLAEYSYDGKKGYGIAEFLMKK